MCKSGIYRIDGPNGKFYVGSAKHISRRWIEHRRDLRKGRHGNPKLQCAWNCHGEDSFQFSVIEYVETLADLIVREQHWIDALDAAVVGYNVLPTAGSHLGRKHSEETKRKMSKAHLGRKHGPMSEEQKAYLSALYKGKPLAKDRLLKLIEANTGRKCSDETRRKISEAHKGKSKSEAHKQALAKANLGKTLSEETRQKIAIAMQARVAAGVHNFCKGN